jgi:hypothetical protein
MHSISLPDRPFTWVEARRLGLTHKLIDQLISARQLERVLKGVYQCAEVPDTAETRLEAARLVIKPHVVICDRTAAWLHGLDAFEIREHAAGPPIDTCVLTEGSRVRRDGCNGTRRALESSDVMSMEGLLVTTPLRTAHDLGRQLRPTAALAALDGFLRLGQFAANELNLGLDRYIGQRGIVQLRRLAPLASPLADSPGESWTRMSVIDAGLPVPELQIEVRADGMLVGRLDMGYAMLQVAAEFDGVAYHSSPWQRAHDARRRADMEALGWRIIVVRKEDFGADRLRAWTSELRGLITARESSRK